MIGYIELDMVLRVHAHVGVICETCSTPASRWLPNAVVTKGGLGRQLAL